MVFRNSVVDESIGTLFGLYLLCLLFLGYALGGFNDLLTSYEKQEKHEHPK